MTEITPEQEAALRKCNAWNNVKCSACRGQATHDDQRFPLRGQPFFQAFCVDCLKKTPEERKRVTPYEGMTAIKMTPEETEVFLATNAAQVRETRRRTIFADIAAERALQDEKWGGPEHDQNHTVKDWANFIHEHAHKANSAATRGNIREARARLVAVAALAVASLETLDDISAYSKRKK